MPVTFIANREVRTIPKGWRHPRDERGRHRPLLPFEQYPASREARRQWIAEYEGIPRRRDFMPEPNGATQIAAYETTSEGTPISPAFPNTPEGKLALANWCAENATTFGDNKADAETWAAILFSETPAAVDPHGRVTFA